METTKKRPGRKPGEYKVYGRQVIMRLDKSLYRRLRQVIAARGGHQAEVLRSMVAEEHERLGLADQPEGE